MNKNIVVESLLLLVAVIWALNFSVVKISLEEIDPMSFNVFRFMLAITLVGFIILRSGESLKVHKGDWPKLILLGILGNLTYQLLFIFGINFTFSANAAVMLGTIPVWIALVGHFFFGERLTPFKLAGVIFAFLGIYLIMEGSELGITLQSETILGDLIILSAAFVFAIYTLFSKKMLSRYTPIQFTTFMMFTGGTALIIAGLPSAVQLDYSNVSLLSWAGVTYSGLLSIGGAYIIWNYGIRQVGPVRTSTYQNLVPVMGLIFGLLILDEKLTIMQYIGSLSVITGIILARKK